MTKLNQTTVLLISMFLGGCASQPANTVVVPTMPLQMAVDMSKASSNQSLDMGTSRYTPKQVSFGDVPQPVIAPPTIKMVYMKERIDSEGVIHYAQWVALPVDQYKWVMPDGRVTEITAGAGVVQ